METWQKLILAAGGALGVAALLHYLLSPEDETEEAEPGAESASAPKQLSLEELLELLHEMAGSAANAKASLQKLSKELSDERLTFAELYAKVAEAEPEDPLEKRGLTFADMDAVLQRHSGNPEVIAAMRKLGGADGPSTEPASKKAQTISVAKIVELNKFMLAVMKEIITEFEGLPAKEKDKYQIRTVVSTSQAAVNARVSVKFGLESEDFEQAIMLHQAELMNNQDFMVTHAEMSQVMEGWMQSLSSKA